MYMTVKTLVAQLSHKKWRLMCLQPFSKCFEKWWFSHIQRQIIPHYFVNQWPQNHTFLCFHVFGNGEHCSRSLNPYYIYGDIKFPINTKCQVNILALITFSLTLLIAHNDKHCHIVRVELAPSLKCQGCIPFHEDIIIKQRKNAH